MTPATSDCQENFSGHFKVYNSNNPQPNDQDFAYFPRFHIQRTGTNWTISGDACETPDGPTPTGKPFSIRLNTAGPNRKVTLEFDENLWELGERTEVKIETEGDSKVRVTYIYRSPGQGPTNNGAWILRPGTIFTATDRQ